MNWHGALQELGAVLDAIDPAEIEAACAFIARSGAIMGYAGGGARG